MSGGVSELVNWLVSTELGWGCFIKLFYSHVFMFSLVVSHLSSLPLSLNFSLIPTSLSLSQCTWSLVSESASEWRSEWVSELVNWLASEWVGEWVEEWVSKWVSKWASEWVSRLVSEWVSQWVVGMLLWTFMNYEDGLMILWMFSGGIIFQLEVRNGGKEVSAIKQSLTYLFFLTFSPV